VWAESAKAAESREYYAVQHNQIAALL